MAEDLQQLLDEHGRYLVITEASCYLIDLAAHTLVRVPDVGLGSEVAATVVSATLRGDHLPLKLVRCVGVQVGQRPLFLLDLRGDGVLTCRLSTPVRRIERLPD